MSTLFVKYAPLVMFDINFAHIWLNISDFLVARESATALLLAEESDGLQSQQRVFEASPPDSSALVAMGVVLVLCVVAGLVWANEVVPVSRTKVRARA